MQNPIQPSPFPGFVVFPCPWCESVDLSVSEVEDFQIRCMGCRALGPKTATFEAALLRWNENTVITKLILKNPTHILLIDNELKSLTKRRNVLLNEAKIAAADGLRVPFVECVHPEDLWTSHGNYHYRCLLCDAVSPRYGLKPDFKEETPKL